MEKELDYQDILTFWFEETDSSQWFDKDEAFDDEIMQRFSDVHQKVASGELWKWRESIRGRLAEIIVLDQFSRNMFRDQAKAFQYDSLALILAQEAIASDTLDELTTEERSFYYMPFMHSESSLIHEIASVLFQEEGMEDNLRYEIEHRDIIERFGRYPHRNNVLGRESTEEELTFLEEFEGF